VDKSGDPVLDPDDRNKYLEIADWVNTKVRAEYSGMFKSSVGVGDGLRGGRGKSKAFIDTASLQAMSPIQRAEWYRKNSAK
jgi:hypothetical protein